jgi:hypothetical protein
LGLDYYRRAVDVILQQCRGAHFFVFSDDPDWARANVEVPAPLHFVTHNSARPDFEDLRLMSLCRHHIIANSSFSWWGAWLNGGSGKVVVAPTQWFIDPRIDTRDLIPPGWIRV